MKSALLPALFLLLACTGFAKTFTISKDEFVRQFRDSCTPRLFACYEESGDKVWLQPEAVTELHLITRSGEKKIMTLESVRYSDGSFTGKKIGYFTRIGDRFSVPADDIVSLNIIARFDINMQIKTYPYFNLDSCVRIVDARNDSIRKVYSSGSQYVILVSDSKSRDGKPRRIMENACYALRFKDGWITQHGVVSKITKDSLYISSKFLFKDIAKLNLANGLRRYHVSEISELLLPTTDGYDARAIHTADATVSVVQEDRKPLEYTYWYALSPATGAVKLCRTYLLDAGFFGINTKDGTVQLANQEIEENCR